MAGGGRSLKGGGLEEPPSYSRSWCRRWGLVGVWRIGFLPGPEERASTARRPRGAGPADSTPRMQALVDEARRTGRKERGQLGPTWKKSTARIPRIGSRAAVWVLAQLHLFFAAFVLAVPIFAVIIEFIGYKTGDKRYDKLAYEFTKLLSVSFSFTAALGAFLLFMLVLLVPEVHELPDARLLADVRCPTSRCSSSRRSSSTATTTAGASSARSVHLFLGMMLNIVGTAIMLIANAWLTFMTSPAGVSETGARISTWDAVNNYTWMPINIHRIIANVAFGGVRSPRPTPRSSFLHGQDRRGARPLRLDGLHRQLSSRSCAFLPLPFAGYYLASRDLRLLADDGLHDDGRRLLVALHRPGGADRQRSSSPPTTTSGSGWRASRALERFRARHQVLCSSSIDPVFDDLGDAALDGR